VLSTFRLHCHCHCLSLPKISPWSLSIPHLKGLKARICRTPTETRRPPRRSDVCTPTLFPHLEHGRKDTFKLPDLTGHFPPTLNFIIEEFCPPCLPTHDVPEPPSSSFPAMAPRDRGETRRSPSVISCQISSNIYPRNIIITSYRKIDDSIICPDLDTPTQNVVEPNHKPFPISNSSQLKFDEFEIHVGAQIYP
jgi:hypothetical protein